MVLPSFGRARETRNLPTARTRIEADAESEPFLGAQGRTGFD